MNEPLQARGPVPFERTPEDRQLFGHVGRREVAGQTQHQCRQVGRRRIVPGFAAPRDEAVSRRIGTFEQVGHAGRRGPATITMIEDEIDELRQPVAGPEVGSGCDSFERQRGVRGRAQGHERFDGSLKLQEEQNPSALADSGGPDHVGMAPLKRLPADQPAGLLAERREVDLRRPLGRVAADENLGHAAVGEDRFEKGVVHGVPGRWDSKVGGVRGRTHGGMGTGPDGRPARHSSSSAEGKNGGQVFLYGVPNRDKARRSAGMGDFPRGTLRGWTAIPGANAQARPRCQLHMT